MGEFDDILGTKKKPELKCRKCGSNNTEASKKFYSNGNAFGINGIKYITYQQYIRCYNCGEKYLTKGKEAIGSYSKDAIIKISH